MILHIIHNIKYIVTALVVTMFFSCKNNFNEVKQIGVSQNAPVGVAETINLKRTDSGRVVANLLSPKMLDYSNRDFGFNEFPDGLHLILFDDKNQKSDIFADYGIVYEKNNLIDLQGNVIIATHAKDTLFAKQLYYDQKNAWVFTNQPVTFKSSEYLTNGNGFDSNSKFTNAQVLEVTGIISVQE